MRARSWTSSTTSLLSSRRCRRWTPPASSLCLIRSAAASGCAKMQLRRLTAVRPTCATPPRSRTGCSWSPRSSNRYAAMFDRTVAELGRALASRQVSAVELAKLYLERIERHNDLNAYLDVRPEVTLAQARAADQRIARSEATPLTGVPI